MMAWWPWLLCAAVLVTMGLRRTHVLHEWLAIGAFVGCALLLVIGTCWGGSGEAAADEAARDPTGRNGWT
jgi:hypothetical protein